MIALHEGDISYASNPRRGAQFYPDCVQIEVTGDGTAELPKGVSFPGAYSYEDPGVVHNVITASLLPCCSVPYYIMQIAHPNTPHAQVYCSTETKKPKTSTTPCATEYVIPGPTVWSGAWPETTKVSVGLPTGVTTHVPWSTWIVNSVVTSAVFSDVASQTVVGTSTYTAHWGDVYQTPDVGEGGRW
jgi:cellulase